MRYVQARPERLTEPHNRPHDGNPEHGQPRAGATSAQTQRLPAGGGELCVLTVAAETISGATQLPDPDQLWSGSHQFQFSAHRKLSVAVSGVAQETKHFSDLAQHTSFQLLERVHDLKGRCKW